MEEWNEANDMPLLLRKQRLSQREPFIHMPSHREIVYTDNSPAQWAFYCAMKNCTPSLEQIKKMLANHEVLIVMAASKEQLKVIKYMGILSKCGVHLNA